MSDSYSVSYITNTMRGAPVINGATPGALIAALDALLISGWGAASPSTLVVAGGIATATFASATAWESGAVIAVSAATPSAINGKARVLTSGSAVMTFATTAPDGSYTGATIKYASAGWEKLFSGTNKACYRSTDAQSAKFVLYVDDSSGLFARVRGFESMSDINTGIGPFPLDAQMTGGGYWHKATVATGTAVPYLICADSRVLLHAIAAGIANSPSYAYAVVRGFGDPIPLSPAGDPYACMLSCNWSSVSSIFAGALNSGSDSATNIGVTVCSRGWQGVGASTLQRTFPQTGDSSVSGNCSLMGAAPSGVDGQIKTSPILLKDLSSGAPARAIVPGVYYIPQSGAAPLLGGHEQTFRRWRSC